MTSDLLKHDYRASKVTDRILSHYKSADTSCCYNTQVAPFLEVTSDIGSIPLFSELLQSSCSLSLQFSIIFDCDDNVRLALELYLALLSKQLTILQTSILMSHFVPPKFKISTRTSMTFLKAFRFVGKALDPTYIITVIYVSILITLILLA